MLFMAIKCCADCVYGVSKTWTSYVECHRFPPLKDGFPTSPKDSWCGEFKAKEEYREGTDA